MFILNLWSFIPDVIKVLLISMSPFFELRLSIPMGIFNYNINIYEVFLISVLGNSLIVIPLMVFLKFFVKKLMDKFILFDKFFSKIFEKTRAKHSHKMEIYGDIALIVLVAVPLPGTGAYTGALIAYLFGVPYRRAFLLISMGVFLAGIIVSILSAGVDSIL